MIRRINQSLGVARSRIDCLATSVGDINELYISMLIEALFELFSFSKPHSRFLLHHNDWIIVWLIFWFLLFIFPITFFSCASTLLRFSSSIIPQFLPDLVQSYGKCLVEHQLIWEYLGSLYFDFPLALQDLSQSLVSFALFLSRIYYLCSSWTFQCKHPWY